MPANTFTHTVCVGVCGEEFFTLEKVESQRKNIVLQDLTKLGSGYRVVGVRCLNGAELRLTVSFCVASPACMRLILLSCDIYL